SLRDQPGLADPRVADDRDQLAAIPGPRPLPGLPDDCELTVAADETRLVAAIGRRTDADEPVGGNGIGLPLQVERRNRLDVDRFADERERGLADQHLAGCGRLLQAGC